MRKLVRTSHLYLLPSKAAECPRVPTFNKNKAEDSYTLPLTWPHAPGQQVSPCSLYYSLPQVVCLPIAWIRVGRRSRHGILGGCCSLNQTVRLNRICHDCFHFETGNKCTSEPIVLPSLTISWQVTGAVTSGSHQGHAWLYAWLLLNTVPSSH